MSISPVYLGTSSWTGAGWETAFYPPGSKAADYLPFYATKFNSVEIDSTFYRIPTAKTVQQWRDRTPEGFIFAAKLPQVITHEKVLVGSEDDLKAFVEVMNILGPKLGPLLIQLPYFNKQKFDGLDSFLKVVEPFLGWLPKGHRWALEIRNKQWLCEKFFSVLKNYGVAFTLIDQAWMPRPSEVFRCGDPITADFIYTRWLGDRKEIEKRTLVWDKTIIDRTAELREWVGILNPIQTKGVTIYVYANNHYAGFAPATIKLFNELWGE